LNGFIEPDEEKQPNKEKQRPPPSPVRRVVLEALWSALVAAGFGGLVGFSEGCGRVFELKPGGGQAAGFIVFLPFFIAVYGGSGFVLGAVVGATLGAPAGAAFGYGRLRGEVRLRSPWIWRAARIALWVALCAVLSYPRPFETLLVELGMLDKVNDRPQPSPPDTPPP
jgi:hypothetical protein